MIEIKDLKKNQTILASFKLEKHADQMMSLFDISGSDERFTITKETSRGFGGILYFLIIMTKVKK